MENEALKTQLFRLVDVLPALRSPEEVSAHMREYLGDGPTAQVPFLLKFGSRAAGISPWLTALAARKGVEQMSRQFILAENPEAALPKLRDLRKAGIGFTADLLGEAVVSEREAEQFLRRYYQLLDVLSAEAAQWPKVPQIDQGAHGPVPRVNVSVKISAMYSQIRPVDPEGALAILERRLAPLLAHAKALGAFINFDMESTSFKEITIALFKRLLQRAELRDYPHFGIALQAYLKNSETDLNGIIHWARAQNRRVTIRLIKGAYWDYETALAEQRSWPSPVWDQKAETDAQFEKLAALMLQNCQVVDCAFGTHNARSIAACTAWAEELGVPRHGLEFQMLYGMAEPLKQALVQSGWRVRDYAPVGEVLPGMSYLVRRLLENSSNEGFLRASFGEHQSPDELLRKPMPAVIRTPTSNNSFQNEPLTDWTIRTNRETMRASIERVRGRLGRDHPLLIEGRAISTSSYFERHNPSRPEEVVGRVSQAAAEEAQAAIAAAEKAWVGWRNTSVEQRAAVLDRTAALLRERRFDLAALEMFETGKNWSESDADIAEAIDFCLFYALEMRRISRAHVDLPGESNLHEYIPRGIGVVIAPWNFPLAILCGMTVAGLVTGNCVLMKPAETSAIIASEFARILHEAGCPPGVLAYLPGPGRHLGKFLVEHPKVEFIAFTGSRAVGLEIYQAAGETRPGQFHLKNVVCEMGGKNAMIIDSDADLDEAIPAIVQSAFGYSGQKCSALSRLICLPENYETVLARLIEATRSIVIGPPEEPATLLGPLIDQQAAERVREYIETGKSEARLAFEGAVPEHVRGWFVPPVIFSEVPPTSRIAQEEIFGPVIAVIKAVDFSHALELANDCPYALTGGLFSRSPAHIEQARRDFRVGNLYINRSLTGALVARQPFGGFRMSGGGSKAGGPDYLLNFLYQRVITENTMRRGFAPNPAPPGE